MPHVRELPSGKFRIEVFTNGVRRSRVFETRKLALDWAGQESNRIKRRTQAELVLASAQEMGLLPLRMADAIANIPYTHEDVVSAALPATISCGIYFLIRKDRVVYVGQSTNVFHRLGQHQRSGDRQFDSFNVLACQPEQLDALEADFIAAFMPDGNWTFGRRERVLRPVTLPALCAASPASS